MDHYTILEPLGRGTFGEVRLAMHKDDNILYAVKMSPVDSDGIPPTSLREISNLVVTKDHPYIVSLRDVVLTDEHICLIMERADMNLHTFMGSFAARKIGRGLVTKFARQMTEAVAYCHSLGVVHRDIKPQNILVDIAVERVKLCDFGLTRLSRMDDARLLTTEVATLWYRPPELLLGSAYDWTIDVWSLGCVLGEMATGRPLFPGDSQIDTVFRIFRCEPSAPLCAPNPHVRQAVAVPCAVGRLLGTPIAGHLLTLTENWNVCFPRFEGHDLRALFHERLGENGIELLVRMLCMDYTDRISSAAAAKHPFAVASLDL